MSFIKRIYLISFLVFFSNSTVFASGIEASYGFGVATGSYQLDADEGTLDGTSYFSPIHLFYMAEMGSTSRLTVEFFHYDFKFESKPAQTLGTHVLNSGFNFLYEEELKLSNFFKPILGVGLQVSKLVQTARHRTTTSGALDTTNGSPFADKDDFVASAIFSAGYDIHFTKSTFLYTRVMQTLGISNQLTETQLLLGVMFRK